MRGLRPASLLALILLAVLFVVADIWSLWPRAAALLGVQYNTLIVLVGTSLPGSVSRPASYGWAMWSGSSMNQCAHGFWTQCSRKST